MISAKDLKSAGIELEQLRMSSRAIKHPCTRDAYRFSWFLNMIKKNYNHIERTMKNHNNTTQQQYATITIANILANGSSDLYFQMLLLVQSLVA